MKLVYTYVVDESILERFGNATPQERQELLRIFHALGQYPFQPGDYTQKTPSLRILQVKRVGKWLITYWPNHAEGELRIVEVIKLVS